MSCPGWTVSVGDDPEVIVTDHAYAPMTETYAGNGALGAPWEVAVAGPPPYRVYRLLPHRAFGFRATGDVTPTRWVLPSAGR
jgi:hypothetical protein